MKFEDLIVGMRVRDHIGNTYEVVALAADDSYGYGIKLCCETLVKPVQASYAATFDRVGRSFWIQRSRNVLLNADDPAVQQIIVAYGYTLPLKEYFKLSLTNAFGVVRDFYVYPECRYKAFELTCDDLRLVSRPLTALDLSIGMRLVDSNNNGFVLVGYDDRVVHLAHMIPGLTTPDEYVPAIVSVRLKDGLLHDYTPAAD